MTRPAISARGLSKQYTVAAVRNRHDSLRDEIAAGVASMFSRGSAQQSQTEFWALRDVSFDIEQGDVVGVVGGNGAGKSTLLKLLSRITEPTLGRAEIHGRIGTLLEVGTGFDRELTGRENVYLSGAILGMKKREIDRKFDEIVAFAEVEPFIETPVKRYSSGMYLRLAFAVAAYLEPEILILDEVLAVGDAKFQARCLGRMSEVAEQGRTVLFVSHNMAAITRLCPRCIWLDHGNLREIGPSAEVVAKYLALGDQQAGQVAYPPETAPGSEYVRLMAVRTLNELGEVTSAVTGDKPISIEIEYRILRDSAGLRFGVTLIASDGTVVLSSKDQDFLPEGQPRAPGRYVSRITLPANFLNAGQYFVTVGSDFPMIQGHFRADRVLSFRIDEVGGVGSHLSDRREGYIRMRFPWTVEQREERLQHILY